MMARLLLLLLGVCSRAGASFIGNMSERQHYSASASGPRRVSTEGAKANFSANFGSGMVLQRAPAHAAVYGFVEADGAISEVGRR